MTMLEWKATYPYQRGPRLGNSERALSDVSYPEVIEAGSSSEINSALELKKAPGTAREKYMNRMAVKAGDKIVLLSMSDVVWIQSHGNLIRLHLQDAGYEHRMTIKDMYKRMDPERFLRVHRNAIVNLDYVTEFDLPRCGNSFVHLRNGKVLPISGTARVVLRRGLLSQSYAWTGADDNWH